MLCSSSMKTSPVPGGTPPSLPEALDRKRKKTEFSANFDLARRRLDHFTFDACGNSSSESDSGSDEELLGSAFCTEASCALPSKGDPVWVKYKQNYFWPGVVFYRMQRTKKLYILLLEHERSKIYVQYRRSNILPFNHKERSKHEATGKAMELEESHIFFTAALDQMEEYMNWQTLAPSAQFEELISTSDKIVN